MTSRDRQILRAVRTGHGQIECAEIGVGVLLIDGRYCADQIAARRLVDTRLVAPAIPGQAGMRVLAVLTDAGRVALTGQAVAA